MYPNFVITSLQVGKVIKRIMGIKTLVIKIPVLFSILTVTDIHKPTSVDAVMFAYLIVIRLVSCLDTTLQPTARESLSFCVASDPY